MHDDGKPWRFLARAASLLFALLWVTACVTNPVTGKKEFSLVSESEELSMGRESYAPLQQLDGGLFRLDPQLSAYVSEVGHRIAAVSDRPLDYEFVVLNNGEPNAWALPGGKIAVNRGLLYELDSEAELAALLGHEVVHAAARHTARRQTRGQLLGIAVALGAHAAQGHEHQDSIIGIASIGAGLINQRYGRKAESEADHYGILYMLRAGYAPQAAVGLQEAFVRLSQGRKRGWLEGLFASHPPSEQRVQDNQATVNDLAASWQGKGLRVGRERYRQATAYLDKTRPAYDAFEEAERAYAEERPHLAMRRVDEAIRALPEEARFHGLKGHLLYLAERGGEALDSYGKALALDDSYYEYYLGRGFTMLALDRGAKARGDLERSYELLPTASAASELGKLAEQAGERQTAKRYFAAAAEASGELGTEAREAFVRLDIPDNPGNYVQVEAFADDSGRVYARVTNSSQLPLSLIAVEVATYIDGMAKRQELSTTDLEPNTYEDLRSSLALPANRDWTQDMLHAEVTAAAP